MEPLDDLKKELYEIAGKVLAGELVDIRRDTYPLLDAAYRAGKEAGRNEAADYLSEKYSMYDHLVELQQLIEAARTLKD